MPEARGERRSAAKTFGLALALAVPIALTPIAARALVDHLASAAGAAIAALSDSLGARTDPQHQSPLEPAIDPSPSARDFAAGDRALDADLPAIDSAERTLPSRNLSSGRPRPLTAAHRGILVRADVVARAVRSGVRPSGAPVAASGMRPSGVALLGVSAFGAGLYDGDIVTAVGGTTTTSPGTIIAAVAGAVRSGARAISAVIWRDQQEIRVTVEIPPITRRAQERDAR